MNNKTVSIVSYVILIGWLIAYFAGRDNADNFAKYHLKQGFGLIIFAFALAILLRIIIQFTGIYFLLVIELISPGLMVIGIINAANGVEKPLPFIGKMFENKFTFIG